MRDWRRVPDWGDEPPQHKSGGEGGWGQPPASSARSSSSKHRKPPPAPGSWQATVPLWEKKFCTAVCRIPWRKICETKRLMSYYSNVINWDDFAGKEAFDNAKARFFAEINGLPCDISLPGPDIYIDEIDWDAEIDPQLLLDLDKEFLPPDSEAKDGTIELLSTGWDRAIPCTGWGDAEDVISPVRDAQAVSGWPSSGDNCGDVKGWDQSRGWADGAVESSGWGAGAREDNSGLGEGAWDDSAGWGADSWENKGGWRTGTWEDNSGWGARCWEDNFRCGAGDWEKASNNNRHSNSWRQQGGNRNNYTGYWESKKYARKRESDGLYGSRSPGFRQQRDDFHQQSYNHWRISRGRKRANHQNMQPAFNEPLVPRQY